MPKKNGADRSKTESQISLEDILSRRQPRARDELEILYGCRPPETPSIENRIEDENWIKRQRLILDDSSAKKK